MRIASLVAAGVALVALSACNETVYGDRGYYGSSGYGGGGFGSGGYYGDRGYYGNRGYYGGDYYGDRGYYGKRGNRDRDYSRGGHRYDEHYNKTTQRPSLPPAVLNNPIVGGLGRDNLPHDKRPARDQDPSQMSESVNTTH